MSYRPPQDTQQKQPISRSMLDPPVTPVHDSRARPAEARPGPCRWPAPAPARRQTARRGTRRRVKPGVTLVIDLRSVVAAEGAIVEPGDDSHQSRPPASTPPMPGCPSRDRVTTLRLAR